MSGLFNFYLSLHTEDKPVTVMVIAIVAKSRIYHSQIYKSPTYSALREMGNCHFNVGRWGLLRQKATLFLKIKPLTS